MLNHYGEQTRLLASIVQSSHDAIITKTPEGIITSWNAAAERLYGYSAAEMIGRSVKTLVAPEHQDELDRIMTKVLRGDPFEAIDVIRKRKDGISVEVSLTLSGIRDDAGNLIAISAIGHDVTERSQSERRLRESNELMTAILEGSSDAITLKDINGCYLLVNRAFCELVGKQKHELLGQNFREVYPTEIRELLEENEKQVLDRRQPQSFEERHRLHGSLRVLFVTRAPRFDPNGEIIGTIMFARDFTDRVAMLDHLAHSQRLEAIGTLAGGVAHDFNNLLMAIGSCTELILELSEEQPRIRNYATQIINACQRGASLTQQLLAFGRKQMINPKVVILNRLVADTISIVKRLIGEQIQFVFSPAAKRMVNVDPGQFQQVIINLCLNARDAMPKGGKLAVETSDVVLDSTYIDKHSMVVPGRYVLLAVSDTGHGMTPEVQARIFEPFFTTKPPGKGTGLGLAMVYGIVKQNNGFIWVYSEPGKGSCFKLYLPVCDAELPDHCVIAREAPKDAVMGNILLVEDEESLRTVLREYLVAHGHRVWAAGNGEEATKVAAQACNNIDLLLTDLVMPGMSGVQTAEQVLKFHPKASVICMSGYTEELAEIPKIMSCRCRFIQKPVALGELARAITEALAKPDPQQQMRTKGDLN